MNLFHRKEKGDSNKPNRLINEKSPYLLQHAHNPVDWYPWGGEAFEKATLENKPIFLSIGYSTCHWCHVMEDESFSDPQVAELINQTFVPVKVDREERPDLDDIYMYVCQVITGGGGWPLTVILTPEKLPFFAATYIPKETTGNFIGLLDLIPQIDNLWSERRDDLMGSAVQFANSLRMFTSSSETAFEDNEVIEEAYTQFKEQYDTRNGGFGDAPKFPSPHILLFLLRYWKKSGNQHSLDMVEKTLQQMRGGGIYDQLGYGFHRYTTDTSWRKPHFEKMLYDQAMLTIAYTEAYQATGKEEYKNTAEEIISYVTSNLTDPQGGFYCAEDADTEGKEGKYYTWSAKESSNVLDSEERDLAFKAYGIKEGGNVEEDMTQEHSGMNILHRNLSVFNLAEEFNIPEEEVRTRLENIRKKLYSVRLQRVRPAKDDKILADWNGLMIAALAKASRVFDNSSYLQAAKKAANFILSSMVKSPENLMYHRFRDGEAAIPGYSDDYAFVIWGLLEIYEADFDVTYFGNALKLNEFMIEHFWDEDEGGFFTSADYGEDLLLKRKESYDDAYPSANSIAFQNQLVIGRITAKPEFDERVAKMKAAFSGDIVRSPALFSFMIMNFMLQRGQEVIIAGNTSSKDTLDMIDNINHRFLPFTITVFKPTDVDSPEIVKYVDFLKDYTAKEGKATAFVCTDHSCKPPVTNVEEVLNFLNAA
ncbi:Thymidylate kinase [Chitinispirillum alkaliphilum]|nr:Thymidylate kinase [Chitinispirillum alkaliphilum]